MARSPAPETTASRAAARIPPHAFFLVSAVFHYLGPAFAVLLFAHLDVLGVAWLRIASAAVVFAAWRRPWRMVRRLPSSDRWTLLALGVVLGLMNCSFYLALARLPLGTVGAIEFLGPIALAALGVRTRRNLLALGLAVAGVSLLADVRLGGQPLGFAFALVNCALFVLYVVLAHRIAQRGAGIDGLGAAMLVGLVVVMPIGLGGAAPAFASPLLLAAGIGVGVCSSVIPYVTDQLAMARLSRATYALLLSLLPATATAIGVVVLAQFPTPLELAGIGLVIGGVAVHRERTDRD
jgi:inner membrane transporter RhtA